MNTHTTRPRGLAAVVAAAILGCLIGLWISPGRAYAEQLEPAEHTVKHVRVVTHTEQTAPRRMFVELNNGAAYRLRPCHYEDSHGCYWNASTMGDGYGWSFVSVRVAGRGECTLYLDHPRRNYCTRTH